MLQRILAETGWQPDVADPRDFTPERENVVQLLTGLAEIKHRPEQVDWRSFSPEVASTDAIPSSTQACVDLLEHHERRVLGYQLELSRPFVHMTAKRLALAQAAQPFSLRTIWKAVVRFGVPTWQSWPGQNDDLETEPDAFAYSVARDYSKLMYIRLDPRRQSTGKTLNIVRWFLAAGFGCVFGFPLSTSLTIGGDIGFPTFFDTVRGSHAVMAIGYDDSRRVRSDRGCLLVRSSWGQQWGEQGYGWLPYSYIRERLASDFWTILQPDWLRTEEFKRPYKQD